MSKKRDQKTARALLLELVGILQQRDSPGPWVDEANVVIGYLKKRYAEECVRISDSARLADESIEEDLGIEAAVALSPELLTATSSGAGSSSERIAMLRMILSTAEFAIKHGMWVEGYLLRMVAWSAADPTGFTPIHLHQEMYQEPKTAHLRETEEDTIIGASTELAHLVTMLCDAVADKQRPKNELAF